MSDKIRTFDSGATRDTVEGKLDYVKALCPLVLRRFVQYLDKHRLQPDGNMRDFDNWKKGIPRETYHSSKGRHFFADWLLEEGHKVSDNHGPVNEEDALCGELFNTMGKLRVILLKKDKEFICPEGWVVKFHDGDNDCGWWVLGPKGHLHKNLTINGTTGKESWHGYGEAPGYWPTKQEAEDALQQYLEKQKELGPNGFCKACENKIEEAAPMAVVHLCKACLRGRKPYHRKEQK